MLNKVQLIGNLGADPDVRATGGGTTVTNVRMATTEYWKDSKSGQSQERTEWHRVTFFGRQAEVVSKFLRKGSKIYIEGRLQTDKWQDKNGQDRYTTQIVAKEFKMLDPKSDTNSSAPPSETTEVRSLEDVPY